MTSNSSLHAWGKDSLLAKATIYVAEMESHTADEWQHGFWSAMALELIARAALAHISPTLLADTKDWRNTTYALGHAPTAKRFTPTSVTISDVFARLQELVPTFTQEHIDFCLKHIALRNAEVHTGECVFQGVGTSSWLPRFYAASKVLLESMGNNVSDLFSSSDAVEEMIQAMQDQAAQAVAQDIKAHSKVWNNKTETERATLLDQSAAWATRQYGHRVKCPSCDSPSLLNGNPSGVVSTSVGDDEVVQRQTMIPSSFECVACGLKVVGLSKLSACGLGDAFTERTSMSAAEFFGLHTEEELQEALWEYPPAEADNNE